MALVAPVTVPSFIINDQRALDGAELMTDKYNYEQRQLNPNHVDVTIMAYMRTRLVNWLRREADRLDPLTSQDPDIIRQAYQRSLNNGS